MNQSRKVYIEQALVVKDDLLTLFKNEEKIILFEIGSCEGEDSVKYSRLFPKANIYAFEPIPNNVELIKKNLVLYDVKNVTIIQKALSSEKGNAEFNLSEGQPEGVDNSDWDYGNKSSSLLEPDKHIDIASFIKFDNKILVETDTIFGFCSQNSINIIDYIHMDVQGAELLVLKGAGDFIKNIKCIWLEVAEIPLYKNQPLAKDIYKFMSNNDFVLIKDCVEHLTGDHLYVSKRHFPNYKQLFPNGAWKQPYLLKKVLGRIKRRIQSIFNK